MYCQTDEERLIADQEKLNKIVDKVDDFVTATNKWKTEFEVILKKMEKMKDEINLPRSIHNNHYFDCVWGNPTTKSGPDTCICYYRFWKPRIYIDEIVELVGEEYILWSN